MKKIWKTIRIFFCNLIRLIDKKIIMPITKLIVSLTGRLDHSGKGFEYWISKTNSLLFVSLILAVIIFIVIDQKILVFSDSSAEVLRELPVTVVYNEEAYVVEGLPETVDITLIGSKTDLYIAKQSPSYDVRIDLTGLKAGTHRVNIKYNQVSSSIEYKVSPSVATVVIYPKVSVNKTLTYDLLNQDQLDSKMIVQHVTIPQDYVVVKGAEHQLSQVAIVKALVDLSQIAKQEVGTSTLRDVPLRAYDENGDVVDVEIVPAKMDVEIELASPSKELPIKVVPVGELAFGKAISSINLSETKVIVYGSNALLDELQYIPVEIDVANLNNNRQYKVALTKPVGIRSMSVNNVTINVTVDTMNEKRVTNVNIEYKNLDDQYTVQGVSADDTQVTVNLKGVKTVLDQIKAEDITAYLDLSGYTEGEYEVEVNVEGTDVKVQYTSMTKKVKIKIVKK